MKLNNIRPGKAARYLIKKGWEGGIREGSHETYYKTENGVTKSVQIIYNNKTIYWKSMKEVVRRTGIPENEWLKECK